uniref:LEF-6 late expression factor 6 n=1 Tax=Spodoptera littoralis nuclear polyhedrosis virus TaxID=10456 RepID=A0A3G4S8U6_NPVSL|nr:LEF-6 late expression factor 6 [Spodoptera littoralis nucleopolyhedrovirus]
MNGDNQMFVVNVHNERYTKSLIKAIINYACSGRVLQNIDWHMSTRRFVYAKTKSAAMAVCRLDGKLYMPYGDVFSCSLSRNRRYHTRRRDYSDESLWRSQSRRRKRQRDEYRQSTNEVEGMNGSGGGGRDDYDTDYELNRYEDNEIINMMYT